jgi:hypothetical protein
MADGVRDVDLHGNILEPNKIVIVNIKDCPVKVKNGKTTFSTDRVRQAIVLNYGGTNYGYAMPKKNLENCSILRRKFVVQKGLVYVCSWHQKLAEIWEQIEVQRDQV